MDNFLPALKVHFPQTYRALTPRLSYSVNYKNKKLGYRWQAVHGATFLCNMQWLGLPHKHAHPFLLPLCIWSFYVQGCGRNYGYPKLGYTGAPPLGRGGALDPLQTSCYPTWVTMPNLIVIDQMVRAYGDLPENMDSPHPAFQGSVASIYRNITSISIFRIISYCPQKY